MEGRGGGREEGEEMLLLLWGDGAAPLPRARALSPVPAFLPFFPFAPAPRPSPPYLLPSPPLLCFADITL